MTIIGFGVAWWWGGKGAIAMHENPYRAPQSNASAIREIDEAEWRKRSNWLGPLWCGIYRSKLDSRLIVPHPVLQVAILNPFNYGHPKVWWAVSFCIALGGVIGALVIMWIRHF